MQQETKSERSNNLERRLIELAWTGHAFAELLQKDPRQALATIGVEVSPGVKIDVRQQRRDTLLAYLTGGTYVAPSSGYVNTGRRSRTVRKSLRSRLDRSGRIVSE